MSAVEDQVRVVLDQLLDPAFAGVFEDVLAARRTEMDEGEEPAVRRAQGALAGELLDELVESVAAELALREFALDVKNVSRRSVDYVLISVVGHLDEATAPQVREAIKAARTPDGYRSIAIDLTAATVHGRRGLSPLVNAFFSARRRGEFHLIGGSAMERRVLNQIAGGSLRTYASVAELDQALDAESLAGAR